MVISIKNKRNMFSLMVAHCAGMLDLIALPVWVGTLITHYHFDSQQAGGLVTLFLFGATFASVLFAPRYARHDAMRIVAWGFTFAAMAFLLSANNSDLTTLAFLHFIGGFAAGSALSFTHGTIGNSENPHRVFAIVGMSVGIFGIVFLGGAPIIVSRFGGSSLFLVFAAIMGVAAVVGFFHFPRTRHNIDSDESKPSNAKLAPLGRTVWLTVFAISLMAMAQGMTISFYETIGLAQGFGRESVTLALIVYGFATLFPAPLAAFLEKRVSATSVLCTVPVMQAVCAMTVTHTSNYILYTVGGSLMAFTIIFTHTYAFGLLAKLDPSGRATAGTPAMLMAGATIAPFFSGTLVKVIGFEAIGYATVVLVILELLFYNEVRRAISRTSAATLRPQVASLSSSIEN